MAAAVSETKKNKTVIVGGSRNWGNFVKIEQDLLALNLEPTDMLVIGDGFGLDEILAVVGSKVIGCQVRTVKTDWTKHAKQAPFKRMEDMVKGGADLIVCFVNDDAPASQKLIMEGRKADIETKVIWGQYQPGGAAVATNRDEVQY
jgi:hypothetical protein